MRHMENMSKIIMATGSMVGYAYGIEFFIAWYSGNAYEKFAFINRAFGPYWWAYWIMVSCNVIIAAVVLVQKHPPECRGSFSSSPFSSTSACGSSGS